MKRLLALILSLALLCGTLPAGAAAPDAAPYSVADFAASGTLPESAPSAAESTAADSSLPTGQETADPALSLPPESDAADAALSVVPELLDAAPQTAPITVTLRVELYDSTHQLPVSITLPAQYKPLADYGFVVKNDPGYFTPLHLLAEYCIANGLEPVKDFIDVSSTGFVSDFLELKGSNNLPDAYGSKLTDTSFMFAVNNQFPQRSDGVGYTLADYPLAEGDTVVLYDMWYSSETICGNYSYFSSTELTGYTEEAVSMKLNGFSGMSGKASSMEGAELLFYDKDGTALPDSSATATTVGADGTAQVTFAAPGTYLISAKRLSGFYHSYPFTYAHDISRPYCKVTVTEALPMSDAEAVAYAAEKLTLGELSAVTEALALPSEGLRGTSVAWEISNSAIAADGTVIRPAYGSADVSVTLTATITRGDAQMKKSFAATVKAFTQAEIEAELKAAVDSVYISKTLSSTTATNLVSLWEKALAKDHHTEITVSIKSSENPNIAADGSITFNKYYHKNYVTVQFETQGVFYEKREMYTVNTMPLTAQEQVDTVAELLGFDDIKGSNTDPSFITKSPSKPSKMDGYSGVKISWASSDSSALSVSSYSITVKRPALGAADKPVNLIATVTRAGATSKTATIALVVPAFTTELEALSVSAGTLTFDKAVSEYTLHLPQNAASLVVTAKPRDTAVTLLRIGSESFRSNSNREKSATIPLPDAVTEVPVEVTCSGSTATTTITVIKDAPENPALTAFWGSFRKGQSGNALLASSALPATGQETALRWESSVKEPGALTSYPGSPLIVGDQIYLARENQLLVLDAATGALRGSVSLSAKTGYASLIAYGEGRIFVPLSGGIIECIDAATLASLWVSESLGGETLQALSPVSYLNGKIFCGFYDYGSDSGTIGMIDPAKAPAASGAKRWSATFGTAGCYGSGVIAAGSHLVMADEAGTVRLLSGDAVQLSAFTVDSAVRSLPVFAEGAVYLTTARGTLYRFVIEADALRCTGKAALPESSVAAPVIANGKVFAVGGSFGSAGFCAVFDAKTLASVATLRTEGPLQSSPVAVQTQAQGVLLYSAENTVSGRLICFAFDGQTLTAETLYTPRIGNYTTSSPVVTEDGTLLYGTDAGTLFALCKTSAPVTTPTPVPTPIPGDTAVSPPSVPQATATPKPAKKKPATAPKPTASPLPEETASPELLALRTAIEQAAPYCNLRWAAGKEIPAALFALLETAEDCTLVLDFGSYTVSFSSDTVKAGAEPVTLSLNELSLSAAHTAKLHPGAVGFTLVAEGTLPGPATVVYPYSETGASLFALQGEEVGAPRTVTVQDGYAMFTLEQPGDFALGTLTEPAEGQTTASNPSLLPVFAFGGVAALLLVVFIILKKRGNRG